MDVPVIMQRRFLSTVKVPQIQFIAGVMDIPVRNREGTRLSAVVVMVAMKGVFGLFRPFFALLQVVWSSAPVFGALDGEEFFAIEGSCTIHSQHLSTWTFRLKDRVKKQQQQQGSEGVRVSFCVTVRLSPVVDTSAAWRTRRRWWRRQRRLRSWWRHEQQSVAMPLSSAAHHSYDKVAAGEKYDGLRAQKTDRAGEAGSTETDVQSSRVLRVVRRRHRGGAARGSR